jgi:hypothetical protein
MFDQTPINRLKDFGWGAVEPMDPRLDSSHNQRVQESHSVKQLLTDLVELAELQIRLIRSDVRKSFALAVRPLVGLLLAGVVLIGAIPVLLFAVASFLESQLGWSLAVAQLSIAGLAGLIGVLLLVAGIRSCRQCCRPIQRSLDELSENYTRLKGLLDQTND